MTREEAIRRVGILTGYEYDEYLQALNFAISDMERAEQLETENKRLKDGIEKAKAEIHTLDDLNPDYPMDRTIHVSKWAVIDIINKYLGE